MLIDTLIQGRNQDFNLEGGQSINKQKTWTSLNFILFFKICVTFFFFRILSIFNTHTRRGEKFLKKLTVVYIQNGLTFGYTVQVLNLFNSHSFFNVRLTHYFFFLRILSIFNTHTQEEGRMSQRNLQWCRSRRA